jgi:hypothetical protein
MAPSPMSRILRPRISDVVVLSDDVCFFWGKSGRAQCAEGTAGKFSAICAGADALMDRVELRTLILVSR